MHSKNSIETIIEIEISDIRGASVKSSISMTGDQENTDCESSNLNNNHSFSFSDIADATTSVFLKAFR